MARILFGLEASQGFLFAGGGPQLASELITCSIEDLDHFASNPNTSVTEANEALIGALAHRDHDVSVIQDSVTFCRMLVRRGRTRSCRPGHGLASAQRAAARTDDGDAPSLRG